jgi:hypothetical protein
MKKRKEIYAMEYELQKLLERDRKEPYPPRRKRIDELKKKIKNRRQG